MKVQKYILAILTLALMGATATVLLHLSKHERLGDPGVKTRPLAGSKTLEILMPETVPGYTSEILTNVEAGLAVLPPDTSYRSRWYQADDHFGVQITTVLMGTDRSSIHNPQICLPGQGWAINDSKTRVENIPMERPFPYELPVNRIVADKQVKNADGTIQAVSSVYLYWFVDADQYTASEWKRKVWLVPHDLLVNGVLDRWAYIACFAECASGGEDATTERMKKMIAETAPEFQLVPHAAR
jgi:hypothetical protein